jgi:hypothetical protein
MRTLKFITSAQAVELSMINRYGKISVKSQRVKKCKLHPKYKGLKYPKSKKTGCQCQKVWFNKLATSLENFKSC